MVSWSEWDTVRFIRKRAEYCFESTVLEQRTHWASLSFGAISVSSGKNSVNSARATKLTEFGVWNRTLLSWALTGQKFKLNFAIFLGGLRPEFGKRRNLRIPSWPLCSQLFSRLLKGGFCKAGILSPWFHELCWVGTASGPFSENNFHPPPKLAKKWVLAKIPKWVQSGFRPTFDPFLHPKTHFWSHFSPLTKTHLKPTLSGNKLFSKKRALRQPWPNIIHEANETRSGS